MDDKFDNLRKQFEAARPFALTREQLTDITFRLLCGQDAQEIAKKYKISVAKVLEVKHRGY
jgi:predicted RNA polymerase sigma factor